MFKFKNFTTVFSVLFITFISSKSYSENHNIYEVLDLIRKDIKTLEKAVYSGSLNNNLNNSNRIYALGLILEGLMSVKNVIVAKKKVFAII